MRRTVLVLSLAVAGMLLTYSTSLAQVASRGSFIARAAAGGTVLVGPNSSDSKFGPDFWGDIGHGLSNGFTLYAESGYGWSNYKSDDALRLKQIPLMAGLTYDIGYAMHSEIVQPFVGLGAGAQRIMLERNGTTVTVDRIDQNATDFGLEGVVGVSLEAPSRTVALNIRAAYNHDFAADKSSTGIPGQSRNNVGISGGIAYFFGM